MSESAHTSKDRISQHAQPSGLKSSWFSQPAKGVKMELPPTPPSATFRNSDLSLPQSESSPEHSALLTRDDFQANVILTNFPPYWHISRNLFKDCQ